MFSSVHGGGELPASSSGDHRHLLLRHRSSSSSSAAADPFEPTLAALAAAGFAKARDAQLSAFARVLGGAAWALQQLVAREDAATGRVQWDALFRPLEALKDRLGLAQDVARRVDALPRGAAAPVQPHQLLLQDFGDIGAVHRLIVELLAQLADGAPHLEAVRAHRRYQQLLYPPAEAAVPPPVSADVRVVQQAFRPRRRWQFALSGDAGKSEAEDALVQRCLLEFGERVCVAAALDDDGGRASAAGGADAAPLSDDDGNVAQAANLMAQLASQAAAAASAPSARRGRRSKRLADPQAADFELQYQRALRQAAAEQKELLSTQKAREQQLLQHAVSAPELLPEAEDDEPAALGPRGSSSARLETVRAALQTHEVHVEQLIVEKRALEALAQGVQEQAAAVGHAVAAFEHELQVLDTVEAQDASAQPLLQALKALVAQNEALKRSKRELRDRSCAETAALEARVAQLKLRAAEDLANRDEETLRLHEIEQMHAQMAAKHKEMRAALAQQTRAVQRTMRQIDEVPTRLELIQYEKRFLELYEEVALTLDETRKYFCTYNTLKTTLGFLEKEIALINSIHDNFDVAMGSKAAAQAFFAQLEGIIQGVQGSVRKQQAARADRQSAVESLDSRYQLLLEKERAYVNAIREFQRECEKNERLAARLLQAHQAQQPAGSAATHGP